MAVRIFFVRHGETDWNRDVRIQGASDIPLNSAGEAQAAAVAERLQSEEFDVIASSTLQRARRTADIIAAHHSGTRRLSLPGLTEMGFGEYEGRSVQGESEYAREFRRIFDIWEAGNGQDVCFPGGESPNSVTFRARKALQDDILPLTGVKRQCLVVGHGRCLRLLIASLLGLKLGRVQMLNATISILDWHSQRQDWTLVSINDASHLRGLPLVPTFIQQVDALNKSRSPEQQQS